MKVNINKLILFTLCIVILILCFILDVELMLIAVIGIWLTLISFSLNDIKNRSMLFAFLVTFFIFLIGRDLMQQLFSYKVEIFDKTVQFHAYLSYIISLITIGIFYKIFELSLQNKKNKFIIKEDSDYKNNISKLSLLIYYPSWIFAIISKISISSFVAERGFTDYYTDYADYISENNIMYLISKLELIMPVALCIYLATMPSKKDIRKPLILYIIYFIVSLGTGQRSTAMLGILFLFIYFVYRNGQSSEVWISKKMIICFCISIPLMMIFASYYSVIREGGNISNTNIFESFINFFYDQGVTSNVLKRAYMYKDSIPDNQIYTLEFLHSGILARIFGIKVFHGNTIEHAMHGGSLTHTLGYIIMGESYLLGRGSGSCYIAELYQDFGYIGVFIGNILYSYIFTKIARANRRYNILVNSIFFLLITHILWAPRGSFSAFITQNFIPTTLFVFIFIFALNTYLLKKKIVL